MNTLVALWCMLLAADRVDVFAGAGPFVLTPFLLLTPLVVLSALEPFPGTRRLTWTHGPWLPPIWVSVLHLP